MGILSATVPRDLYDALQARYDDLLNKYHALRPTHAPVAPMRTSRPQEEPGARALHAAEASITNPKIAQIADKLMDANPSLTKLAAMIEAKRLDDIARGRAVAPAAAGSSEPPSR